MDIYNQMKKVKPRMNNWTESQKEWLGYKRRMSVMKKKDITLAKPPWEKEPLDKEKVKDGR